MGIKAHACDRVLSVAMEPWAITRTMLAVVARVLGRRLGGDPLSFDDDSPGFERRPPAGPVTANGYAVIPIHGVIAPRMNAFSDISGGSTFEQATAALADAVAHPRVQAIVLDIDSPGGSVLGASEFARRVMAARTKKPIIASANYQMCSAAYWLGACATEVVAAPSAVLGSIGVFTIHEDLSKALEDAGVKLTYISAGKYKVDGVDGQPLTETAAGRLQTQVDAHYARFIGDVAKGRGLTDAAVRDGYGQGACVNADEALALGMIDRIETLDETIGRLFPASSSNPAPMIPARATATAPVPADTVQEPTTATTQDLARIRRETQAALLALSF